jgi:hypothetical protein
VYDKSLIPGTVVVGSTNTPTPSLPFRLLSGLSTLKKNSDAIKLLNNVQVAALHLACMFEFNRGSVEEVVRISMYPWAYLLPLNLGFVERSQSIP